MVARKVVVVAGYGQLLRPRLGLQLDAQRTVNLNIVSIPGLAQLVRP
jgi:hypothetical protein